MGSTYRICPLSFYFAFAGRTFMEDKIKEFSKAAIVGVITGGVGEAEVNISLDELTRLLDTAGGEVAIRMTQQ